ncbi:SMR family transporter [Wohlfahrtiimonas chitiniclastica]|uniref:DMT family transporter n=1 Tax=Wohlfahrtiimonas chitiniclastica TaxID=400946 RepID=UPI0007B40C76|nr:SMR family transporter [Wohlfahrtiimonas chitiniclastica]KZS23815.1 hypothetical protein BMY_1685 [Wohlfahrtiimonas chitiniclastica]MBS7828480.1 QacE family quaternary ammonium compound efflux SMR transporter [Wohlfahrtiimonas chitiniclastica]MBS7836169.1 QacE family quaternary ammonium compound efflux SMR transporter [Wohlfahrtiimonas chitiniclastica]MDC7251728.1 QacE family quaternary ammonium compound efflux SMR transporter [Wohlfahrtiimonas chitiniclastica]OYQ74793.1 ligand-binding prot
MNNKAWFYVGLTSVFELIWLYGFNRADAPWEWALVVLFIFMDLNFLAKACQYLAAGTVYAVFAAVGTIGTILMDTFLLEQTISTAMMVCMGLILLGVLGLNLSDPSADEEEENHG